MIKITLLLLIVSLGLSAQTNDSTAIKYANKLSPENLKNNLNVLASDEYEGRETGRKGQKMAAEYIVAQFKAAGVMPYKNNTYYQEFLLNEKQPGLIEISINGKAYKPNIDYYNFPGEVYKSKTKKIQFLGYGIDDKKYNDYTNTDVKNKTVMILSGEPMRKDSVYIISGNTAKSGWTDRAKIKYAKEKGIKTLLIVKDEIDKEIIKNKHKIESPAMTLKNKKEETSVIYISKKMANDLLGQTATIDELKNELTEQKKPVNTELKTKLFIQTETKAAQISTENVLGYIEGGDLKNELIVISAHYDHLGIQNNKIYNGADDDGSGTVALIELAKAFATAKQEGKGNRRSILFIGFAGEEKGLLGSSYYTDYPEFPLANTVCDLNIDMIGRIDEKHGTNPDYVYLIGSDKLSSELHSISENINKTYTHLELDYTYNDEKDKNRFYYRSDHYNFAKNGIPVIFYFNGVHNDYHQPTDDVEKINFEKITKISRLVFYTAWELANREERIKVDSNKK